jgi:hypothetical protein
MSRHNAEQGVHGISLLMETVVDGQVLFQWHIHKIAANTLKINIG